MDWLKTLDSGLFRWVNLGLSNSAFDWFMPHLSSHPLFFPLILVLALALLWKGGVRGRVFVAAMVVIIALGDGSIISTLKEAIGRPRPFVDIPEAHLLVGRGRSQSMPSGHASSWFAATLIAWVYYRRSWYAMLPMACLIAFSRVYLGVHYPSDVLAGAILGAGYAAALLCAAELAWRWAGPRWFAIWHRQLPSILHPERRLVAPDGAAGPTSVEDWSWVRLGYVVLVAVLLARLAYLASGTIELSEDEAYQWLWSKHLALSYYSKPPMIAYLQFLGTALWGDNEFGVRFFSPVLSAVLGWLMLRFMAREISPCAGFCMVAVTTATPLLGVGSILMTIDPPLVFFWTAAVMAGWKALQPGAGLRAWLWVGLWAGLGFLSKYSALFLVLCWAMFFLAWPAARIHLRRPGPYLALAIVVLSMVPVVVWNAAHGWITVAHVASNARLGKPWTPQVRWFFEFLGAEAALLNPVFFVAAFCAMVGAWRHPQRLGLEIYLFCMGVPLFLGYWSYTLHSQVLPNWIAPAVIPMLALMVTHGHRRWIEGLAALKQWLALGLCVGCAVVVVLHNTDLIGKVTGRYLPTPVDPLRRVRGWSATAQAVGQARQRLLAEGKDVFIIGSHYGITGQLSFYLPEARTGLPAKPLVYYQTSATPKNQFFFWPEYRYRDTRKGQNAIFVCDTWKLQVPPPVLLEEFGSVRDLGLQEIRVKGRVLRQVQLFECRTLH